MCVYICYIMKGKTAAKEVHRNIKVMRLYISERERGDKERQKEEKKGRQK